VPDIDDQLSQIRRMWTYRAFVWAWRLVFLAVLLFLPACLWPDPLLRVVAALVAGGLILSIPFRVVAFWKIDVPFMVLLRQATDEAIPPLLRKATTIQIPVRSPKVIRTLQAIQPVQEPPASTSDERLRALRRAWPYRTAVWGYRLMFVSVLGCCGGMITLEATELGAPTWLVIWPIITLMVGLVLTTPLRFATEFRVHLPRGRIALRAFKDTFNPTFY
jgi:hypothetical protein